MNYKIKSIRHEIADTHRGYSHRLVAELEVRMFGAALADRNAGQNTVVDPSGDVTIFGDWTSYRGVAKIRIGGPVLGQERSFFVVTPYYDGTFPPDIIMECKTFQGE